MKPVKTASVLVYHGKHSDEYYLVDTPARLEAAQRRLFEQLDQWGCYTDEDANHLAMARSGNIRAIRGILQSRTCYEYEGWEIEEAEICGNGSMSFADYQTAAYALATYPRNMLIVYPALGLAGEAGEVANKVKKIYRDDGGTLTDERREQIKKELEDTLWYVAAVASDIGVTLADIAADNIANLTGRKNRDTLHGDGDDR